MKNSKNGEEFKINSKGSLGILAYGDIGIRIWRKAKNTNSQDKTINPANEEQ